MTPLRVLDKPFRTDKLAFIQTVIRREDSARRFASESVLLHRWRQINYYQIRHLVAKNLS